MVVSWWIAAFLPSGDKRRVQKTKEDSMENKTVYFTGTL